MKFSDAIKKWTLWTCGSVLIHFVIGGLQTPPIHACIVRQGTLTAVFYNAKSIRLPAEIGIAENNRAIRLRSQNIINPVKHSGGNTVVAGPGSIIQQRKPPLRLDQVKELMNLLTDQALAGEIQDRGVDFKIDNRVLEELRLLASRSELDRKRQTISLLESYLGNSDPSVTLSQGRDFIVRGQSLEVFAKVTDTDTDRSKFYFIWDVSRPGSFEGGGDKINLITSDVPSTQEAVEIKVTVTVKDREGGSATSSRFIRVGSPFHVSLDVSEGTVLKGAVVDLVAKIAGDVGSGVKYRWEKNWGKIEGESAEVKLHTGSAGAPNQDLSIEVKVTVTDSRDISVEASRTIYVKVPATLRLTANIANVDVVIDGNPKGAVSQSARELNVFPGERIIEARKEGFISWKRSFLLKPNTHEDILIEMKPLDLRARRVALKRLSVALRLFEEGDYEKAIVKCNEGLEADSTNAELMELRKKLDQKKEDLIKQGLWPPPKKPSPAPKVFTEATVKETKAAVYPPLAKRHNISGRVEVEVTIDAQGNTILAKALDGNPMLHQAAEEAALKWKFYPAQLDGKPIESKKKIVFNFQN
jgi:TonB family protein